MRYFSTFVLLICTLATNCFALDIDTEVDWIDFQDWDHNLVAGLGQTFNDIYDGDDADGPVDVTVRATGDFSLPTVPFRGGDGFVSQLGQAGLQRFELVFSQQARLVVRYNTTDEFENLDVLALDVGPHEHTGGAVPMVRNIRGGQTVTGTASGISSTGASSGFFEVGPGVNRLTIVHETMASFKYEEIEVGIVSIQVPEPSGSWLAAFAFPVFMLQVRRQQRKRSRNGKQND